MIFTKNRQKQNTPGKKYPGCEENLRIFDTLPFLMGGGDDQLHDDGYGDHQHNKGDQTHIVRACDIVDSGQTEYFSSKRI